MPANIYIMRQTIISNENYFLWACVFAFYLINFEIEKTDILLHTIDINFVQGMPN